MSANDPAMRVMLDTVEAAGLLEISPRALVHWRSKNKGPPYIRVGGVIRYRRRDVENWLATNTVVPSLAVEKLGH